jgi:hypothetical protein
MLGFILPAVGAGLSLAGSLQDQKRQKKALNAANAALEASKANAGALNADTEALLNPAMEHQIRAGTNAVMGQYGGAGNMYGSAAQRAVLDRAQTTAAGGWDSAAARALAMQQGNANITAGQAANRIAGAYAQTSPLTTIGNFASSFFS